MKTIYTKIGSLIEVIYDLYLNALASKRMSDNAELISIEVEDL